jgi:methanogenic corrinoid protein MtbC1
LFLLKIFQDNFSKAINYYLLISNQKILINTENLQIQPATKTDKIFVLYLPSNEIHELGLMYLNYEILLNGYKTIYLGESVPTSSLLDVKKYFDNIVFVCYTTVEPTKSEINDYIVDLKNKLLDSDTELWLLGRMTENISPKNHSNKIQIFNSIDAFSQKL